MLSRYLLSLTQSPEGKLWETPGDNEAPPSSPATQAPATVGAPAAPLAIQRAPVQAPTTSVPEGYVPSYRVRETREQAIREANAYYAQREAQIRAQADQYRQQLHSLVGVTPPQNPEIAAVRDQFGNLYPGLSKVEERAEEILSLLERQGDQEAQIGHYWMSYGRQTMDRLFDHASKSLGGPLSDEAKRQLHSSFTGFVQSSPEMTSRYANDPSIVEDFWKVFTSSFIDPARRVASASAQGRLPGALPQDTPGGVPHVSQGPQPGNLEERAQVAWAKYNQDKGGL